MATQPASSADEISAALAETGRLLGERAPQLAGPAAERMNAAMPFPVEYSLTSQSIETVRAIIVAFARMLERGLRREDIEVPSEVIEQSRAYVRRDLDMRLLMGQYRLGHAELGLLAENLLNEIEPDAEWLDAAQARCRKRLFEYMDLVSDAVLGEYLTARERWQHSAEALRAETVRDVLSSADTHIDRASAILKYRLELNHIGVVVWRHDDGILDGRVLEDMIAATGEAVGVRSTLVHQTGARVGFGWLGFSEARGAPDLDAVDGAELRRSGVDMAFGGPGSGPSGFRAAHRDARAARRLAIACEGGPGTVINWNQVAALGMLSAEIDQAREFVARELGELAEEGETVARLRATLTVYFREGDNIAQAAEAIGVHPNTVAYRVRQCEELLGRSVRERRFELEAALRLRDRVRLSAVERADGGDQG